jgi:hypothetical protein
MQHLQDAKAVHHILEFSARRFRGEPEWVEWSNPLTILEQDIVAEREERAFQGRKYT